MSWDIGVSLPLGYAAISVVSPRRRRVIGRIWIVGVVFGAAAASVLAWALH